MLFILCINVNGEKKSLHLTFGDVTLCGLVMGIKVSAKSDASIFIVDLKI
jgi:hypothetical protein